ncbi:MAG: hypothetical protein GTO55_03230 [Armatimonadetes bacterium]|nr:hypothetical protein [Armatimonadota bacterium]NIO55423.1 hypothetical protein [Candidatus Latescibacterota bacterium]NIM23291.1 hypothetical protein [Armatimonadota bacterium]NIM67155.1 hypothetical protein [Armatimonadota bacterium]NIM75682.1 hypothetical protein [Armatimonadota bacterium]
MKIIILSVCIAGLLSMSLLAGACAGAMRPETEHEYLPNAQSEWHTILYVGRHRDRPALRLRAFPYPGFDVLLWVSPPEKGVLSYLPSPSYSRVALTWENVREGRSRLFLVPVDGGPVEEITQKADNAKFVVWKDDETVACLGDNAEWTFNVLTKQAERVEPHAEVRSRDYGRRVLAFLEPAFAREIQVLRQLIRKERLHIPLSEREACLAILRGVGVPLRYPLISHIPIPRPVAAVSPDGKELALTTGTDAIFVVDLPSGYLHKVIPMTQLVQDEGVSPGHLRWSHDSKHLLFAECHYHPAEFHAPDIGPGLRPFDFTYLIRMYSTETGQVATVAVGDNAFLIPMPKRLLDPRIRNELRLTREEGLEDLEFPDVFKSESKD